jgi:hypothetical protein
VDWDQVPTFPRNSKLIPIIIPVLFVGTDRGVYFSTSLENWEKFGIDLPNTSVAALSFVSSTKNIVAGTGGRGAWETYFPKWDDKTDLVFIWKWIRILEKIPFWRNPPDPEWFSEWESRFLATLVERARGVHGSKAEEGIELGQKSGQPISGTGEYKHTKQIEEK